MTVFCFVQFISKLSVENRKSVIADDSDVHVGVMQQ